jgi:hypothetical protein
MMPKIQPLDFKLARISQQSSGIKVGMIQEQMADYLASPEISSHALKWFRRSPAHYMAAQMGVTQTEQTAAQSIGTMVHSLVLENRTDYVIHPATYESKDGLKPWNWNANFCKDWRAAQTLECVSEEQARKIEAAANAVSNHKLASALLKNGFAERSFYCTDKRTGLRLKGRVDYATDTHFVDLKTTVDASTKAFSRAATGYDYELQAAFYLYIAEQLCTPITDFYFIALEIEPVPMVNVLLVKPEDLELATASIRKQLAAIAQCQEAGHWPGYCDDKANLLTISPWKYAPDESVEVSIPTETMQANEL